MIAVPEWAMDSVRDPAAWLTRSRAGQRLWAKTGLRERLKIVRKLRNEIVREASLILGAFATRTTTNRAERLASEIIPLAEACRFLEREARLILAPRRVPLKPRPFWLRAIEVEERRDPIGVVLIIGPANYPLFLPGVQAVQALVAGNSVIVKPGCGGAGVMRRFQHLAVRAGVPNEAFFVLDEDIAFAKSVIAEGVDKIVLTGSEDTGRAVYREAADNLIPLTLELSGCDPVFVLSGADLERAVAAIGFGLRWNGGETCMAPRRIFVAEQVADAFECLLGAHYPEAARSLPISRFSSEEQVLQTAGESPYALGASVFGQAAAARAFAARVKAGAVVVNDIIMPTADPRVTFEGRGHSGFGATRGAEGLRQFTAPKAVIVQRRKHLRHLEPLPQNAEELFNAYLAASHAAAWSHRLRAAGRLVRAVSRAQGSV